MFRLKRHRQRQRRRARLGKIGTPVRLADAWGVWIADNLLRGAEPEEILDALAESGVPRRVAERELAVIACTPAYDAARVHAARAERHAMALRLLHPSHARPVDRLETITPEDFYRGYFDMLKPLVLTGITEAWPAMTRWGLDDLTDRFGSARVQICSGREGDPYPDANYAEHLEEVTVADFVTRLRNAEGSTCNDFYLIANNNALRDTELSALLDDVVPPPFMSALITNVAASLWIGPRGTVTPLHHDNCNILFCQIVGRKRFRLVPPTESRLLEQPRGFYADPERVSDDAIEHLEVTLEPGTCLFLPMGWWHDVRSLDTSMSISLLRFEKPSSAVWYAPGNVRR